MSLMPRPGASGAPIDLSRRYTVERRPAGTVVYADWCQGAAETAARRHARGMRKAHWVRDTREGGRVVYVAHRQGRRRET